MVTRRSRRFIRIIYVGTFGFGQDGPYAAKPAYDDLIQGLCAVPALLAQSGDGKLRYVSINIADRIVGLHALAAILAALRHRDHTGKGQRIDIPMFETMASFVLGDHLGGLSYQPPLDEGGYARLLASELVLEEVGYSPDIISDLIAEQAVLSERSN